MLKILHFIYFVHKNYFDHDKFKYIKPSFRWGFILAKHTRNIIMVLLSILLFPLIIIHMKLQNSEKFNIFKKSVTDSIESLFSEMNI